MSDAEPFDRFARQRHRARAAAGYARHAFLKDAMADEIVERLGDVARRFEAALDLGCHDGRLGRRLGVADCTFADAGAAFAQVAGGVVCDEDRLPFANASFDLVVSAGALHAVNDLPGALIQIRRALRPDGLFLASFVGGESLAEIRRAFLEAEAALRGGAAARVLPMVDVAAAGGLLQRAGFAMPVVDIDTLTIRYDSLFAAMAELRGMGETNILGGRQPLRRDVLMAAAERFAARADPDGRIPVRVQVIHLSGWAPGPGQPKPLRPGSATASLADALKNRLN
ncbi:MAG: methyltransferase domain-containing protein [Alphaproteobacteria bacterium]|nr:methyltransferase domain-containing protein [Alphaproteobacteria bacterium]